MDTGIVFTIGDPNGIGAEIILKIFNRTNYFSRYNLRVVSPPEVLRFYANLLNLNPIPSSVIIDIPSPPLYKIQPGRINKYAGKISGDAIVKAVELYNQNPELAVKFLTEYSVSKGSQTFSAWKKLYAHLFTKFMDGNIKTVDPDKKFPTVKQPGYGTEWYKLIVKETGDRFKVIGEPGH